VGCEEYKTLKEFLISCNLLKLGKCKQCGTSEALVMKRLDKVDFGLLLDQIRIDEGLDGIMGIVQQEDLKYLVDVIWTRQSMISGQSKFEDLMLTRWRVAEPISPWNCVLLTKQEAFAHLVQPLGVYSKEFCQKVEQKLMMGKEYFKQLPKMVEYARV
jgi:IQ and ubiquitin-like domain-containing protein